MKKYERYKDSGVQWLGQVPEHWEVVPMKRKFSFGKGLTITKGDLTDTGYPVISYGQIHSKQNTGTHTDDCLLRFVPESIIKVNDGSRVNIGDFIFADTSEDLDGCGNCAFIDREGVFAGYHTLVARTADNAVSKYWAYLFQSGLWRSQIRSSVYGIKVFSITQTILKDVDILVPSTNDASMIANYLDSQVSKINEAISEKERMIADMEKYRSSLISETVTKGLNPNAPMKDSGVEWIGEIPEHWDVIRIGLAFPGIGSGTTPDSSNVSYYSDFGYNWLQTGDLTDGNIYETSKHVTELAIKDKGLRIYPEESVVIAMYGATIGKVGFLKIKTSTNQACCVLPPNSNFVPRYTLYLMQACKNRFISLSLGGGQPNISQAIIKEQRIPFATFEEQKNIACFLDDKTVNIDSLISELKFQIEDLKSYKQSVITEAVTGQVDVRDWTPNK